MPETQTIDQMSVDDLFTRAEELRGELGQLRQKQIQGEEISFRSLSQEVEAIDVAITTALLADRRDKVKLASTQGGLRDGKEIDTRSLGQRIVSPDMVEWAAKSGPRSEVFDGTTLDGDFDQLANVRAYSEWGTGGPPGNDPTAAGLLAPVGQPIAPIPRQMKLYLRDLIPKMSTTLRAIPYVRELNPTFDEFASAVAEGGVKPGANFSFQAAVADPTVIAATLVISKQLFEDADAVVQYINQRLPYMVKAQEDWEFLNGSGSWPDVGGILNTPGILSQSLVNTDIAQTVAQGIAQTELHDGMATAAVFNPLDAWKMFMKRAAGGSGTFDAGAPFSAIPLTVWGLPTYRSRAYAQGSVLVADFQRGAMIVDREQVNVQVYRERYAELNQILLVCEERVGLMVFRPDLFVQCAITGAV